MNVQCTDSALKKRAFLSQKVFISGPFEAYKALFSNRKLASRNLASKARRLRMCNKTSVCNVDFAPQSFRDILQQSTSACHIGSSVSRDLSKSAPRNADIKDNCVLIACYSQLAPQCVRSLSPATFQSCLRTDSGL